MSTTILPQGSLILVTGTTGSVGGAVARKILEAGYRIRAPVRDLKKGTLISEAFQKDFKHAFSIVPIADIADVAGLVEMAKTCTGIVHVASDTSMGTDPHDIITPTVTFTTSLLEAAISTPSIRRFIYTSSAGTLPPLTEDVHITPSSWATEAIVEMAWSEPHDYTKILPIYCASKILAEQACWKFVQERNPSFQLNTIVPMTHIGAFVHPELISSMNGMIWGVWNGDEQSIDIINQIGVNCLINLEDSARLHVAALTMDDVQGERILGLGQAFNVNDVLDVMAKIDPRKVLPPRDPSPPQMRATVDMSRSLELLARFGRTSMLGLEESIQQNIASASSVR